MQEQDVNIPIWCRNNMWTYYYGLGTKCEQKQEHGINWSKNKMWTNAGTGNKTSSFTFNLSVWPWPLFYEPGSWEP